ncbi:MAG: hypothetical protein J5678_01240 [Bacteroidaceae bacterium]|nr:hypothetical protein [Bacteroidaceae bacterium]
MQSSNQDAQAEAAMQQAQQAAEQARIAAEEQVKEMQRKQLEDMPKEYAKSMARQEVNRVVSQALPDEVNQLRWGGLRAIPVIGPIVQWIDNIQWLRRLFGSGK